MLKVSTAAHIVLAIDAAITLGAGYATAMEFRICVNANDAAACTDKCSIIGEVEFYLQPPRTVAVKVQPLNTKLEPTIYSLKNCVIIDKNKWSCSDNKAGVMGREEMVDGKYHTTVIVDGKLWPSHCAR